MRVVVFWRRNANRITETSHMMWMFLRQVTSTSAFRPLYLRRGCFYCGRWELCLRQLHSLLDNDTMSACPHVNRKFKNMHRKTIVSMFHIFVMNYLLTVSPRRHVRTKMSKWRNRNWREHNVRTALPDPILNDGKNENISMQFCVAQTSADTDLIL